MEQAVADRANVGPESDDWPRVTVVVSWVGDLPWYFPIWQHTAAQSGFDFLVATPAEPPAGLTSNIRFMRADVAFWEQRVREKLGLEPARLWPYKLCDLRPMLGVLLEKELEGCDYWGHCDLDQAWGQPRRFLTPTIFQNHVRVLQRGHLSLYRNDREGNHLYQLPAAEGAPGYQTVLQDRRHRGFDEWRGINKLIKAAGVSNYHEECVADISPIRFKMTNAKLPNYEHQIFRWIDGRVEQVYYNDEQLGQSTDLPEIREVAYLHFQKRRFTNRTLPAANTTSFLFTPDGFVEGGDDLSLLTRERMRQLNYDNPSYDRKTRQNAATSKIRRLVGSALLGRRYRGSKK